jgi:hypothetical protein
VVHSRMTISRATGSRVARSRDGARARSLARAPGHSDARRPGVPSPRLELSTSVTLQRAGFGMFQGPAHPAILPCKMRVVGSREKDGERRLRPALVVRLSVDDAAEAHGTDGRREAARVPEQGSVKHAHQLFAAGT